MPRNKDFLNKEDQQLLSVYEDVARHIPCELSVEDTKDFWSMGFADNDDDNASDRLEFIRDIHHALTSFLDDASEEEITETIADLHPATVNWLSKNLPLRYRTRFYERPDLTLPNDMVAPNIFQALSNREGSFVPVSKAVQLNYVNTMVEISGCWLSHVDALTLATLLKLKNEKRLKSVGKSVTFETSLTEIARRMGAESPHNAMILRSVWRSLKRLAAVTVEITNSDEEWSIGHIINDEAGHVLTKAGKLLGSASLQIDFGRNFLLLEEKHFTRLDSGILQRLKRKAQATCLYLFLSRQQDYYSGKKWYVIGINKLHNYAGLRPQGKPDYLIKRETIKALKELENEKILTFHFYGNQRLVAVHKDEVDKRSRPPLNRMFQDMSKKNKDKNA
jgi:hypothetical protein